MANQKSSLKIGTNGENQAAHYLQTHGLELLESNYRCPIGEIDLIMRDQNYLVFVEVRLRSNSNYANSLESITRRKQTNIIRTALHYLQEQQWLDQYDCRFDVVGIDDFNTKTTITWLLNAFQA